MPGGGHHHHHSGRINDDPSSESHRHPSLTSQLSLPTVPSLTNPQPPHYSSYTLITTLKGHTSYLCSLTVSGEILYSGSSDQEIRSWPRHHHCSDQVLERDDNVVAEGKGAVKSMAIADDKLFSAHQDHKIRVWKISSDHQNHKFQRIATLPTLTDRAAKILSPGNQVQIRRHRSSTWVHHVDAVAALALSHDEQFLYSVSWDRTLKVWRAAGDFRCLESLASAHDDAINAVAVSSRDGGTVYTGSADTRIKVWRRDESGSGRKHLLVLAETLEKHNSGVNALALSEDGSVLYSGACDRSILVWERNGDGEMVVVGALRGHAESILCLFVVCDLVCSGSADRTVRVWRAAGGGGVDRKYACLAVLEGHAEPVKCLTAAVDCSDDEYMSCSVYSGGLDCDIKVWQISVPVL
ncbi:unnamed protein product [Linum trigynum]